MKNKVGFDIKKSHYWLDNGDVKQCNSTIDGVIVGNNDEEGDNIDGGYLIEFKKGAKVSRPVKTCLSISKDKKVQEVHNRIVCEEGSWGEVLTGCTLGRNAKLTTHIGVTNILVKKGAKLIYTMVHSWAKDTKVLPKTRIVVEEGGEFTSNYICLSRVGNITMYPSCRLAGNNSKASFNSVIMAKEGSTFDVGAEVILEGDNSKCTVRARVVSKGGQVTNRGRMIGEGRKVNGFLECRGLVIKKGLIHAIPEIVAKREDVNLSHEASIGKIDDEVIEYLQTRGYSRDEAIDLVIKGFLDVKKIGVLIK